MGKTTSQLTETIRIPLAARGHAGRCAAQHFGAWAINHKWWRSAMDAVRAGTWKPEPVAFDWGDDDDDETNDEPRYDLVNGVAIIKIDGQMTKKGSSFGGCSTVDTRKAIRCARDDYMVKSILLHICTPGGTVAGTADLADEVLAARRVKPVNAYVSDMCCSAGYWIASQCETIRANVTALVGNIGTYALLEDDTKLQDDIGVRYTLVSTGEYKGLGADGAVTDKLVADTQREVDELNVPFLAAVAAGRKGSITDMATVSDGRAHVGQQALSLGLIDSISSFEEALAAVTPTERSLYMNEAEFRAYAAANPSAVASISQQGHSDAVRAERDRISAVLAAYDLADHPATQSIKLGHDEPTAKLIAKPYADQRKKDAEAAAAERKRLDDELAAKTREVEALKLQIGEQTAVGTSAGAAAASGVRQAGAVKDGDKPAEPPRPSDSGNRAAMKEWAQKHAEWQWAQMSEDARAGFTSKDRFVAVTAAELRGDLRTSGGAKK